MRDRKSIFRENFFRSPLRQSKCQGWRLVNVWTQRLDNKFNIVWALMSAATRGRSMKLHSANCCREIKMFAQTLPVIVTVSIMIDYRDYRVVF